MSTDTPTDAIRDAVEALAQQAVDHRQNAERRSDAGFSAYHAGREAAFHQVLRQLPALACLESHPPQDGLEALRGVVQPGWSLVPDEPTEAMIRAKCDAELRFPSDGDGRSREWILKMMAAGYRAMLASAPNPPGAAGERGETFPRGAGTGTYFRGLPDGTWIMLNSSDQWVSIAAPTWTNPTPPQPQPVLTRAVSDVIGAALKPFAAFADPRRRVTASSPVTAGSAMAKRQLTMGDCYAAVDTLDFLGRAAKAETDGGGR